ncbi:hypothetical protein ACHZ98_15590 [Streptomyces sp. MAR4 CNY-716]
MAAVLRPGAGRPSALSSRLGLWTAAVSVAVAVPLAVAAPVHSDRVIGSAQFSVAFFATVLTGEAVIFALAFSASSSWPSLREIDAHIGFRIWVVLGWIGSMVLGVGMLTGNDVASTFGAVVFLLADALGIFSFVRLFGLASAGGRKRLLSRTLQRRLADLRVSVAETGGRAAEDDVLAAYVRELDAAVIAGDGNAVRDRVEELTATPPPGARAGGEARAGLHLDVLHRLTKAALAGRLDVTVTTACARRLVDSLLTQVKAAGARPRPGELDSDRAAALAGHLGRYCAWLASTAWSMSIRQVASPGAARELVAFAVTTRDAVIFTLDPDPPHAATDADLTSFVTSPLGLLAWIRQFVEFHGSAQAAAFYPVYELLTGTKFQGNYWDGASILAELREALFGAGASRVATPHADRSRAAFGTAEEFDRVWVLVSVGALATLRDPAAAHPPELIRPEFTPDRQLLAAYLRTYASHRYLATGNEAHASLLRLLARAERPDSLWARSTGLVRTCDSGSPVPHVEPHERLAACVLALACRLAPIDAREEAGELRDFLGRLPDQAVTAAHRLATRVLPAADAGAGEPDSEPDPADDLVRRLEILRLPAPPTASATVPAPTPAEAP